MTDTPSFPDELVERIADKIEISPIDVRATLECARGMGWIADRPWREAAADQLEDIAEAIEVTKTDTMMLRSDAIMLAADQLRKDGPLEAPTAPPSPVEPLSRNDFHEPAEIEAYETAYRDGVESGADKPTTPQDVVTRAELDAAFAAYDTQLKCIEQDIRDLKTSNQESEVMQSEGEAAGHRKSARAMVKRAIAANDTNQPGVEQSASSEPSSQAALEPGQLAFRAYMHARGVPACFEMLRLYDKELWAATERTVAASVRAQARAEAFEEAALFCRASKMTVGPESIALEIQAANDAYGDAAVEFERRAAKERGDD